MTVGAGESPAFVRATIAAGVALLWVAAASGPAYAAPEIGDAAPALVVTELDGQTFDLAKLRGKVVLVSYWATWCEPCRREMPTLDAFYKRYHNDGFEMIAISIDFQRDFGKVLKAAAAVGYPTAVSSAVTDDGFGAPAGVPLSYLIDVKGVVRDKFIATPDKLLHDVVVPLLPQRAATAAGAP
jgi:cytochrome c biogenesis protein CcmG, thiol:disulfide interchange protein DsbE